jgi:divalent metal cation (Fe/Co/Zn/Cd) transporter
MDGFLASKASPTAERLLRHGLYLEYATLAWNVVGTGVVMAAAFRTGSAALAGFGLDSLIEIFASTIVVWQLRGINQGRERTALRLIGIAFLLLAVYVFAQSAFVFYTARHPETSAFGIAWLVATVAVMLLLAGGKVATGRRLNNEVLRTEARVTVVDAYLAASVLLGVVLNATVGWWWADPLAGLVLVYYGVKEGREAWRQSAKLC